MAREAGASGREVLKTGDARPPNARRQFYASERELGESVDVDFVHGADKLRAARPSIGIRD